MYTTEYIGRAENCDYCLDNDSIADKQLEITQLSANEYLLRNLGECDFIVNRQKVELAKVDKYTSFRIGNQRIQLSHLFNQSLSNAPKNTTHNTQKTYHLTENTNYLMGASDVCDISLNSPKIAWYAANIHWQADTWYIEKYHTNIIDRWFSKKHKLTQKIGQSISIENYEILLKENGVLHVTNNQKQNLNIYHLDVTNPKNPTHHLIHSLSLPIQAGEFMGIIGPSGAGKSTLLRAIRHIIPYRNGNIYLGKHALHKTPHYLNNIGFVPQDDVVIPTLTVFENLRKAAALRLPSDWPAHALDEKVETLLSMMRLEKQRNNLCIEISGGQRKRVNLALELMLEPNFLLADEVCSGLSAKDTDNILQHLREIADKGKGVLLTIHSPDNEALDVMDTLLVLDVGGLIAYYGPADEAKAYFSSNQSSSPCSSPKSIFDSLEKQKEGSTQRKTSPEQWRDLYRRSAHYRQYIQTRLAEEGSL